jgi:signal transduction histidine kinase
MVSHELKTPMTSMRGYTDLLLSGMMGGLNDQQQKFLEIIAQNIQRMSRQVQDLTDISRIESGRLQMNFASIAYANVVSETLPSVQGLSDEKGIKLNLDIPANLPSVNGDKERLVQVLTNLISNAIKYSPSGTEIMVRFATAEITPSPQATPQPMVVCSVQDSGYGISAEDQQKLFTKFLDAGQAERNQPVQELPHALPAQRDLGADGHPLAQLEGRDGLLGASDDGLLTGDGGQVGHRTVDELRVSDGFA